MMRRIPFASHASDSISRWCESQLWRWWTVNYPLVKSSVFPSCAVCPAAKIHLVMHKLRGHCASGTFSTPAEASNSSSETLIANDTHPSARGVSLPWRPRPDRAGGQFAPLRSSRALVRRSRERPRGPTIVELWKNRFQLIDELLWSLKLLESETSCEESQLHYRTSSTLIDEFIGSIMLEKNVSRIVSVFYEFDFLEDFTRKRSIDNVDCALFMPRQFHLTRLAHWAGWTFPSNING